MFIVEIEIDKHWDPSYKILDNSPENHLNGNGSNIVLSFHDDQTSSIQYMSNSSQALVINNCGISATTGSIILSNFYEAEIYLHFNYQVIYKHFFFLIFSPSN